MGERARIRGLRSGNRKTAGGKFGGEDFGAGLNDLDDEGNVKPKEKQLKTYQA